MELNFNASNSCISDRVSLTWYGIFKRFAKYFSPHAAVTNRTISAKSITISPSIGGFYNATIE